MVFWRMHNLKKISPQKSSFFPSIWVVQKEKVKSWASSDSSISKMDIGKCILICERWPHWCSRPVSKCLRKISMAYFTVGSNILHWSFSHKDVDLLPIPTSCNVTITSLESIPQTLKSFFLSPFISPATKISSLFPLKYCSVTMSCLTPCQLCGLQPTRLPCPSLSPGVCSYSSPLCWWCYLTISYSAAPFSFCLQSFPASLKYQGKVNRTKHQLTMLWNQSIHHRAG